MHANNREEIKEAFAGEIVAIVGLKETGTGDTLCDDAKPIILGENHLPRTGYLACNRAQDQIRSGETWLFLKASHGRRYRLHRQNQSRKLAKQ